MPPTPVVLYRAADGTVPVLDWYGNLPARVQAKIRVVIALLEQHGHELRRPYADYLRDGVYELRAKLQRVNYRVLYGFCGREGVVLLHAIIKQQDRVPDRDVDLAAARLTAFRGDPVTHSWGE